MMGKNVEPLCGSFGMAPPAVFPANKDKANMSDAWQDKLLGRILLAHKSYAEALDRVNASIAEHNAAGDEFDAASKELESARHELNERLRAAATEGA